METRGRELIINKNIVKSVSVNNRHFETSRLFYNKNTGNPKINNTGCYFMNKFFNLYFKADKILNSGVLVK